MTRSTSCHKVIPDKNKVCGRIRFIEMNSYCHVTNNLIFKIFKNSIVKGKNCKKIKIFYNNKMLELNFQRKIIKQAHGLGSCYSSLDLLLSPVVMS